MTAFSNEQRIDSASLSCSGADALPRHVAIIMDGNGRWAQQRGLPRLAGHKAGVDAVRRTVKAAAELGLEALTLYAFSTENWTRPDDEVNDLLGLMRYFIDREINALHDAGIRVRIIGDLSRFPQDLRLVLENAQIKTQDNPNMILAIALGYGARAELTGAVRQLAASVLAGTIAVDQIDESLVDAHLFTSELPELDLLIRTSGEVRLSNFLLWQAAYAELVFVDMLWPDFGHSALTDCLNIYASRNRRFGGL